MDKPDMSKISEPEKKGTTIVAAPDAQAIIVIPIDFATHGEPCLWESGGGMTATGSATIIAGPTGEPKAADYVRRRGSLSNETHARIPVAAGDLVVKADHHREDFDVRVYRIGCIIGGQVEAHLIHRYVLGRWDTVPPEGIMEAVDAAECKALTYHCREPVYIAEGD